MLPGVKHSAVGTTPAKAPMKRSISAGRPASEASSWRCARVGAANLASPTVKSYIGRIAASRRRW